MTDEKKKDLTRIEDLSEYIHSEEDNFEIPGLSDEPPALPEETPPPFEYKNKEEEPSIDLDSIEDSPPLELPETEETTNFETSDSTEFSSDFETPSTFETSEEPLSDFGGTDQTEISGQEFSSEIEPSSDDADLSSSPESFFEQTITESSIENEPTDFEANESFNNDHPIETISEDLTAFSQQDSQPQLVEEKIEKKPLENFSDLKSFAQNITYTNLSAAGNPPFSIIIKDIKFKEDVDDIIILFKEFGVIKNEEEEKTRLSLARGAYLVSRISEYAAIILCHKLRRFDLNILMGLSDEIHPSKSFSAEDKGLISRENLNQNQKAYHDFKKSQLKFADILCTTLTKLEGHEILKYIAPIVDSEIIELSDYFSNSLNEELIKIVKDEDKTLAVRNATLFQNIKASHSKLISEVEGVEAKNKLSIHHIYSQMLDRLKIKALSMKGNGIINVHYSITPLVMQSKYEVPKYQVTCSGDLVWLKTN